MISTDFIEGYHRPRYPGHPEMNGTCNLKTMLEPLLPLLLNLGVGGWCCVLVRGFARAELLRKGIEPLPSCVVDENRALSLTESLVVLRKGAEVPLYRSPVVWASRLGTKGGELLQPSFIAVVIACRGDVWFELGLDVVLYLSLPSPTHHALLDAFHAWADKVSNLLVHDTVLGLAAYNVLSRRSSAVSTTGDIGLSCSLVEVFVSTLDSKGQAGGAEERRGGAHCGWT